MNRRLAIAALLVLGASGALAQGYPRKEMRRPVVGARG